MSGSPNFGGLRVAAFESRKADEMARLIAKFGGEPHVSPSMREVPLDDNSAAVDFAHRLVTGQIEVVVFLTGVGFRLLLETVERKIDRQRYLDALADTVTVCRGPKPVAAMKEVGLAPTHRVPEPNTWRDLLTTLDRHVPLANQTVALQEYGVTNHSLIAGLEARGAQVITVPVYKWDLPVDPGPLEENILALVEGRRDVALFTSAHQVANVLRVAGQHGLAGRLTECLDRVAVASIGPTTSETLRDNDLPVDLEPEHSKMGQLVAAAAERAAEILAGKRGSPRSGPTARPPHPAPGGASPTNGVAPWHNSPFLKACRREPTEFTPIWLMRQAGRYMREYREVRNKTTFLQLCKNPALCSEIMVTAVNRLGVDAAIIFSDLLPILEPMGFDLEFTSGEGPLIHNPVQQAHEVDHVRELEDMSELMFVVETVRHTRRDLPAHLPLIGFAGAPFTLASYAIEGESSRSYVHTKSFMYRDEGAWRALMERFARAITLYLAAQIEAGAQAVQLFDSWVGCLGPDDYRRYVLPYVRQIASNLPAGVPLINFATGNPSLLPLLAEAGGEVIGVDWRIRLDDAWQAVGHEKAVQGNLDPLVLMAEPSEIRRRAQEVLDQAGGRPGHIFNLGHGVLKQTPVEHAIALVEAVHELSAKR